MNVKIGQVWEDCDKRASNLDGSPRRLRVEASLESSTITTASLPKLIKYGILHQAIHSWLNKYTRC